MSVDLKQEYHRLMVEKAELERGIERRQQKIKKLLLGIQALYQKCEEQEAKDEMIGEHNAVKWEPETRALELWSSAESVEEMQGIVVALKRKKAAIVTECSDMMLKLKNLNKTT